MKNHPNRKNNKPAEPEAHVASHEQIEIRTYHIWLASGGGHGNDLQYWLQAEKEIMASTSAGIARSHKS
jgi:hypothetical protein